MLGEGFERHVTGQCDVIRVFSEIRGTWQPYALLVCAGLLDLLDLLDYWELIESAFSEDFEHETVVQN